MTRTKYYINKIEISEEEFFQRLENNNYDSINLTAICECLECGRTHKIEDCCQCTIEESIKEDNLQ